MAVAERVEAPVEQTSSNKYCHLLDREGAALCFADVSGRTKHWAGDRPTLHAMTGNGVSETCPGCGRFRCPKCVSIDGALRSHRNAA